MKKFSIALLLLTLASTSAFAKAKITIVNGDATNFGFNDTTPVQPVGGNSGTTLGQQRLNAFNEAARIWSEILDSDVEIRINASFANLDCDATGAVLGQARTAFFTKDFANAPKAGVLYPVALASKFAKTDLNAGGPHIIAQFNTFGGNGCSFKWYYGLDGKHGADEDLVAVLLHEFGHGLGFAGNVDAASGKYRAGNAPSVFDMNMLDDSTGLRFDQMSNAQRVTASTNDQHLVWAGQKVVDVVPQTLGPTPTLNVSAPSSVAKDYAIAIAAFSSSMTVAGVNGTLAAPADAAEAADAANNLAAGTTTDGCSAYTNVSAITGRIALIDRGRCTFLDKAQRAQAAGAIGVIIVDNRTASSPPGMSGNATLTIPVVSVTQADGNALRAQLGSGVSLRLFGDATRLSGANKNFQPRLYAPSSVEGGSSLYHWDTSASPNLLMEPFISSDLQHVTDLTWYEMMDIGWTGSLTSGAQPPTDPQPQQPTGRRVLKRGK